ncbi:MAG: Asp-tRNA(Asn)/Glu-tRNA(Gln) amidotransferase A subunit family amidase [Pseudohongiellaceae bacterium]|jgi:Asp-tRNA(Asn)/Glu-tRNA(Gln) amidotransferase A subunit family amidase
MCHPNYTTIGLVALLATIVGGCMTERSSESDSERFQFVETTIAKSQSAILAGEISCRGLVNGYLQRIEMFDKSSGINAITQVNANAIGVADAIDQSIAAGEVQPDLFCVPVLVKDNYDTYDMVTTGGSIALKNSIPSDDAFMIKRLRDAGAIILAKTNMAEWAFSPRESVSSSYGRTANAYDIGFVPAGSSGGTASGVAASFGLVGMGSDTGNSIRGPSSHLGLFGIRSTIGLTSRDGIIPLVFDRDIAGPMTRTVEDGVRVFNVVAGFDPADSLTVPDKREADYRDFLNLDGLQGKRIGVFRALVDHEDADPEIKALFYQALIDLSAAGATIIDPVEILDFEKISEQIPFCGRFRYDVGQYFKTLPNPPLLDVNDVLVSGDYAPETKNSLEYFSEFPLNLSPDDWDEECDTWPNNSLRNQLLTNAIAAMERDGLDALVYPSWSNPPAKIDEADEGYKGDNNQMLVPDAGLPAVTVAMGFWDGRLPAGLQFAGRPYSEGTLIELAYAYEQLVTHRRPPVGFEELD